MVQPKGRTYLAVYSMVVTHVCAFLMVLGFLWSAGNPSLKNYGLEINPFFKYQGLHLQLLLLL
ncbi:MAG TPA: hypothetical protein DCZ94_06610 [Lentisphaeria bacterium]|nr:MAG: hypothetical protein A2X48_10770 [Lentisphaerae bacterium GWF2_49_21]HBC86607.1 hypothetical protein [Lentisphaeria bacterium]